MIKNLLRIQKWCGMHVFWISFILAKKKFFFAKCVLQKALFHQKSSSRFGFKGERCGLSTLDEEIKSHISFPLFSIGLGEGKGGEKREKKFFFSPLGFSFTVITTTTPCYIYDRFDVSQFLPIYDTSFSFSPTKLQFFIIFIWLIVCAYPK